MLDWAMMGSIAILAAAGFIHGLFGIGFAMIATPLLALFLDYRAAVLLAALPLLIMALSWLFVHRLQLRHCGLPASLFLAIGLGAAAGAVLQTALPERLSLLLLALALALSALISLFLESNTHLVRINLSTRAPAAFGAMAGLTESALNVGAPFMVLYGAIARLSRAEQLIALNACFALGKAIQVVLMRAVGLPQISWLALGVGTLVGIVAFYLGNAVGNKFSESRFRRVLRYFLVAIVSALILRAIYS